MLRLGGERVAVESPDGGDPRSLLVCVQCTRQHGVESCLVGRECADRDVNSRRPKRLLPVFGRVLAGVAQLRRPSGHALPKLRRKTVERILRHAQRLQALVGQGSAHPRLLPGVGRIGSGGKRRDQSLQQFATGAPVVDTDQDIASDVR
jgi:hypothetical protein